MNNVIYTPATLELPNCWPQNDTIGPITIYYDGPNPMGGDVIFKVGSLTLTTTSGDIIIAPYEGSPIERPNDEPFIPTHVITISKFEPNDFGDVRYSCKILYPPGGPLKQKTLYDSFWSIREEH